MYTLHTTFCTDQSGAGARRQTWKAHSYNRGSIGLAPSRRRQEGAGGAERPAGGGGGAVITVLGIPENVLAWRQRRRRRTNRPPLTEAHHSVQSLC